MDKSIREIKPSLLILAAGLGSRYGGSKQMESIGPSGERIIDYSIYDAYKAGFENIVFVLNGKNKERFYDDIIKPLPEFIKTDYVIQNLSIEEFTGERKTNRVKPWGTGHALLSASPRIEGSFVVINGDDFYGRESFKYAHDFLLNSNNGADSYAMIGYRLENTLSEHGSVSRAVCKINENAKLQEIIELKSVKTVNGKISYSDEKKYGLKLSGEEITSMNMFAFRNTIFDKCEKKFIEFINEYANDTENEFYLPQVIEELIHNSECEVEVIETPEQWFGLTYKQDRMKVKEMIEKLIDSGKYPSKLW